MSLTRIAESKYFKGVALGISLLLIVLISFAAGVRVGMHKALFSARFGENYERNFLGGPDNFDQREMLPLKRMMEKVTDKGMRNAHGVAGEILSLSDTTFVIRNRDNQESTVRVNEGTIVNRGKETVSFDTLTVGENIAVVGKPQEDGVIAAHLIRVFFQKNK